MGSQSRVNWTKTQKSKSAPPSGQPNAGRFAWPGVALTVVTFLLYLLTLAPGLPPTDSGELILAAWSGGVAHAPGFPSYAMLGWLWAHLLPVGRVAWRLNLFSALCTALAVGLTYGLGLRTLTGIRKDPKATRLLFAGGLGAMVLALGRTVWNWATIAEVYALNLVLTAAILVLLLRWADDLSRADGASGGVWPLPLAALLFGIGLGGHLTSIALLAPAIAYWLFANAGWRIWRRHDTPLAILALGVGLAVYASLVPG